MRSLLGAHLKSTGVFRVMFKKIVGGVVALAISAVAVVAQTTLAAVDYGAELTTNLSAINTIWGSIATIVIGVALVTVGVRFFKKAK